MNRLLMCLTMLLFFAGLATAIDVSGEIKTTIWTAANSPYRVTDSILVPTGNTLTIDPGVDVLFNVDVPFVVEGALRVHGTEIDSVRFIKGTASRWGGIRISGGDSISLVYTRVSDADGSSSMFGRGGGIYCTGTGTRLKMSHCSIVRNTADYGGGIFCLGCAVIELVNCTISENQAIKGTGGIYVGASSVTLDSCTIRDNVALPYYKLSADQSAAMPKTCTISGVRYYSVGGIQIGSCFRAVLTDCDISGNTGGTAGGVYSSRTSTKLVRCLISGNLGTPLLHTGYHSTATLINCILYGNTGGYTIKLEDFSFVTLTNCIVWNNATEGVRLSPGCDITYTYSNILSDPLFVDAENGDFRLQSGSPCIGTGEGGADMGAFGWITTDSNNSVVFPLVYLRQNTPNPFNPTTTIAFTLANDGVVSLRVYNALGQQVRTLVNRHTTAGHHTVTWNGRDDRGNAVASGVYLYRLVTGDKVMVKRMTLVR